MICRKKKKHRRELGISAVPERSCHGMSRAYPVEFFLSSAEHCPGVDIILDMW